MTELDTYSVQSHRADRNILCIVGLFANMVDKLICYWAATFHDASLMP